MRRALAAALALALPAPALAQDPAASIRFSPDYAWVTGPETRPGADSPVRLVPLGDRGQAALSLNQYDAFQREYRRQLARLSLRLPIEQAAAQARRAAQESVVRTDGPEPPRQLDLAPLDAGRLSDGPMGPGGG